MSDLAWLKCDACNKDLGVATRQEMQLAVRFKPSLFAVRVAPLHPHEHRQRCRACGWVNIFVPSASSAAEERNPPLTTSWRDATLKAVKR